MAKHTQLYDQHVAAGAKMVDFAGWDMPINYGSQVQEHHQVRNDAGMFDVSHMKIVDMAGEHAQEFLRYLLANNVDRLQTPGKALYSCMLNDQGGVIDDLIVYLLGDGQYRLVLNAATGETDLAWIMGHGRDYQLDVCERDDLSMIAVQGPNARAKAHQVFSDEVCQAAADLKPFYSATVGDWFVAGTGYTGEDGYEIMVPHDQVERLWQGLGEAGVAPVGLGARDTLRLEAGMNLYGTDMDQSTTPLESGLAWTVAWEPADRDFIGRAALEVQRKDSSRPKMVGLVLPDKGVLRGHQKVCLDGAPVGETTSGTFSPTLGKGIALARVSREVGDSCQVEMRGKLVPIKVVKPPFARHGKPCIDLDAL